jgi:hypothetical protein
MPRYDRLRKAGMLTVKEMAALLGITPQWVKIWNRYGLIRGHTCDDKNHCLYEHPGDNPPRKAPSVPGSCARTRKVTSTAAGQTGETAALLNRRGHFGSNLRYWVRNRQRELACLLWTSPAWKMKPRDLWIGWCDEQRQRHLQWIVNNGRFLILPWVHVSGHRPLLLETLVDASRFRGTCYRAANWIYVGQTTGRGRMDREHKAHGQAIKDIYVYPLVRDAKQRLRSGPIR